MEALIGDFLDHSMVIFAPSSLMPRRQPIDLFVCRSKTKAPRDSLMRGRAWKLKMKIAALTYVYNENVNLPIWRRYYGTNFGEENLFVVDRESDDGSTVDLGAANRIRVPRVAFDDRRRRKPVN